MVTRSVVSAVGAGRGRQAGDISLVLRGAGSGRKEPALDGSSCVSLPHCRKDWSTTLPRHRVPHRCQIYCFWQQANTFMSHLSSYHFFPRVFLSPLWNNRFFPSFSKPCPCCLLPGCCKSNMLLLIYCHPVMGTWPFVALPRCWMGSMQLSFFSILFLRKIAGRFRCQSMC